MERIALVINPLAKRFRDDLRPARRLEAILGGAGVSHLCGDVASLKAAAEAIRDDGVEIVAVAGGDGSMSVVLTTLREAFGDARLPKVAFLRGGTMNTVANGVGLRRGRSEALLRRLVRAARQRGGVPTATWDTMDVGGRLGFLTGVGVVYGFLDEYYAAGDPYPTPTTAVSTLARGVASAAVQGALIRRMSRRFRAKVTVDGEVWPEDDFLTVAAGTQDQIGLGFRPFYRSGETPRTFHVVGIHGTAGQFARRLPKVYAGRPMGVDVARDALATEVLLEPDEPHVGYMVDGDLFHEPAPLKITIGPTVRVAMM